MHLDGLHRMIAARGGIESLSADHELLLMIFWYLPAKEFPLFFLSLSITS